MRNIARLYRAKFLFRVRCDGFIQSDDVESLLRKFCLIKAVRCNFIFKLLLLLQNKFYGSINAKLTTKFRDYFDAINIPWKTTFASFIEEIIPLYKLREKELLSTFLSLTAEIKINNPFVNWWPWFLSFWITENPLFVHLFYKRDCSAAATRAKKIEFKVGQTVFLQYQTLKANMALPERQLIKLKRCFALISAPNRGEYQIIIFQLKMCLEYIPSLTWDKSEILILWLIMQNKVKMFPGRFGIILIKEEFKSQ